MAKCKETDIKKMGEMQHDCFSNNTCYRRNYLEYSDGKNT